MSDTPQLLALMQKTRDMRAYDCVKEFEMLAYKLEKENATLREALDNAIMLLRRWNKNDVTDDVVIDTRKVICAVLKEAQP